MLAAEQSLRDGNPQEALRQLQDQVKKDPSNASYRVFLFQLLAVSGQWDRALTQLNVVGDLDAKATAMVQTYREALRCEYLRQQVFAGQRAPMVFGDPEHWVALLLEALKLSAQGQFAQSQALRDEAFELAPAVAGRIDDQPFQWIADADVRLGPLLEAIVNGKYYWVPFHRIQSVEIEKPSDLRDMVWAPVRFTWTNGGDAVGLIPTCYPGSHGSDDPMIQLGRKTLWQEHDSELYTGLGQRLLTTDQGDFALLDVRAIHMGQDSDTDEPDSDAPSADG